jgi:hypothetical protein
MQPALLRPLHWRLLLDAIDGFTDATPSAKLREL